MSRTKKCRKHRWILQKEIVTEAGYFSPRFYSGVSYFDDYGLSYEDYVNLKRLRLEQGRIWMIAINPPKHFVQFYHRAERRFLKTQIRNGLKFDIQDIDIKPLFGPNQAKWDWF